MTRFLKSSLIAAGLVLAAAAGSDPALAGHHARHQASSQQNGSSGTGNSGQAAKPQVQRPQRVPPHPALVNSPRNQNPVVHRNGDQARPRAKHINPVPPHPALRNQPSNQSHVVRRDDDRHRAKKPINSVPPHPALRNQPQAPNPVVRHDRDHDRVVAHDRFRHAPPAIRHRDSRAIAERDREIFRKREHARQRYIARNWYWGHNPHLNWERNRHFGWVRYDPKHFGHIRRHRPVYFGYGWEWMWWGGAYNPFNPPFDFADCHPVVQFGYWRGHPAELGGTMCYDARGPYVLPNSIFVIQLI